MSDRYQSLIHTPVGQRLAKSLGLPNPVRLERYTVGDPLVTGRSPSAARGAEVGWPRASPARSTTSASPP